MHPTLYYSLVFVGLGAAYWLMMTTYVSIILHRVIAHRAFALPRWFSLTVTAVANSFFIYVNPRVWVAEHRLHHAHSDETKDPDKQPEQGFWAWVGYVAARNPGAGEPHLVLVSRDKIFDSAVLRWYSTQLGMWTSQATGFVIPYVTLRGAGGWVVFSYWLGIRLGGLTVRALQSYFAHSSQNGWGYRTYELPDHSSNIRNPFATWLTAGECLQNNHHAKPTLPIHAHKPDEWDAGYEVVRLLDWVGLVDMPAGRRAELYSPKVSKLARESVVEDPVKASFIENSADADARAQPAARAAEPSAN